MDQEEAHWWATTLEGRRQLIWDARNEGYLRAAEDLDVIGPEGVRQRARQIREGARVP